MKRILSLDGGGIRGALSLGYLQKIENILAGRASNCSNPDEFRLSDYFDLIGGTSTGSIIAAGLALGYKVSEIKERYDRLGEMIFGKKHDWWNPLQTLKFLKAEYDQQPLIDALQDFFKDIELGSEKIKTGLCVVAKRADTNSTWLFNNNPDGKFFDSDMGRNRSIPLWKAVRASTAAPTYFVPQVLDVGNDVEGAFLDGGVSMANNPSLDLFKMATMSGFRYNWPTGADNLLLISVGTGNKEYFSRITEITDNSLISWAKEIPDMLMSDANWSNQTILQWISKCPKAKEIDMEIGDLKDECLSPEPLLTYYRYNQVIMKDDLNRLGIKNFTDNEVESLQEMSNAKNCKILYEIGVAAAERDIDDSDFETKFDLT